MATIPYTTAPGAQPGQSVSDETVTLVREAMSDATRAITTSTGLTGYELERPAKVIVPVVTPLVNMLPRRRGAGVDVVHWKAITSFDTARNWGTLAAPFCGRELNGGSVVLWREPGLQLGADRFPFFWTSIGRTDHGEEVEG